MITYNLLESGQVSVHCPFCGEDHSPESALTKICDHLVIYNSGQSDSPEFVKGDLLNKYNDNDEFLDDYLEKTLDDSYLNIKIDLPMPSGISISHIFHK